MTIRQYKVDISSLENYHGAVAIDTETLGLNPHRDRLCVIQMSSGNGNAEVIQIAPGQKEAKHICRLLSDPNIVKIFHYARFDVAILYHSFGVLALDGMQSPYYDEIEILVDNVKCYEDIFRSYRYKIVELEELLEA